MRLYFRLLKFIKPHIWILFLAIIFMILSAFFDCASLTMLVPISDRVLGQQKIVFDRELPLILTRVIDKINATPPLTMLNISVVFVLIIFVLKGVFFFGRSYLLTKLSQLVIYDIRNALYKKIQNFSLEYFSHSVTGHLVSRITYDVDILQGAISVSLTDLVYQFFMMAFLSVGIFYINWKWALMSLVIFPLVAYPIYHVGRVIRKISTQAQEKMGELNRKLFETISGVRIVKAFNMENAEIGKVKAYNFAFFRIMLKLRKRALILGPFTEFIGACGGALVLYYGGREVIAQRMSFGMFILFLGGLLSLVRPCRRLSEIHSINQQGLAAAKRIFDVLDAPVKITEKIKAVELKLINKEIVFDDVSFAYDDKLVLKNINLRVKKGEVVAFVGPSGAGKTTLVNLIPRFYDPTKGRVSIDGIDVKDATFKSLRRQIGVVTQDLILFNDTIRNNIIYGREDATDEEIIKSAKIAEALEFIEALPKKFNTNIGDMGMKLSGGQKQRLAIARAIVSNPPILIMDEATSHLDAESTRLVQEALDHVFINRTVFVIAHRLATVKKVGRIIVLDDGKIIGEGTHDELLVKSSLYKKLCELEFFA
ncbi:MAG: ABC transporter ATP-binding protein [Candidatus Omnitrophota bacterium]